MRVEFLTSDEFETKIAYHIRQITGNPKCHLNYKALFALQDYLQTEIEKMFDEKEDAMQNAWEKSWETAENVINQKLLAAGMNPFMESEENIFHWFGEYKKSLEYQKKRDLEEENEN